MSTGCQCDAKSCWISDLVRAGLRCSVKPRAYLEARLLSDSLHLCQHGILGGFAGTQPGVILAGLPQR